MLLRALHQLVLLGAVWCQELMDLKQGTVCSRNNTPLPVDKQYIIATISGDEQHNLTSNCHIFLKVKQEGWGLMVYIESMYLRSQDDQCIDNIQFGKDDLIPFVTMVRSKKMCGDVNNWAYDVDNGAMHIWMHFGDDRRVYHRENSDAVHLKMIITPYKKTYSPGLTKCRSSGHYIEDSFFCDNFINCATDSSYTGARDESDEICATTTTTTTTTTTVAPSYPTIQTTYINIGFESEDLRLGTIISVSLGVLVGLACCMVCCVKRCSRVSLPSTPTSDPEECHEMRLSGLPTSQQHQRAVTRGTALNPQSSSVLTQHGDTLDQDTLPGVLDSETSRGGDTPPPAYSDIFPEGYQPPKQLSTNLISNDVTSSTQV